MSLRLNHAAISGSSHPIPPQFKYTVSLQKEGIVFNSICLYLWGKKPHKHKTPTVDIKIPNIRYQYFIQRYNSTQYLLFYNIEKTCTESNKNSTLQVRKSSSTNALRTKTSCRFSLALSWCSVWSSMQSKFQIQWNCVSAKSNDLWKRMLPQQNSKAKKVHSELIHNRHCDRNI